MGPRSRRVLLTAHIATSVGWLGATASILALAVAGLTAHDAGRARAAYLAVEIVTVTVVTPLAVTAFLTGVVQALATKWGLLRHYWVVVKFVVTAAALLVLMLQVAPVRNLADVAAKTALTPDDVRAARASLVVHAAGGLLVLLVPLALSVWKPRGLTQRGRRHSAPTP